MLALASNETKAAQKALFEVKALDEARRISVWVPFAICILPVIRAFEHLSTGHPRFLDILLLSVFLVGIPYRLWRMSYLKSRYTANQSLLQELRDSNKCSLDDIAEFAQTHEEPLLQFWNRRLERRAILWRVDAFLSGKKITE